MNKTLFPAFLGALLVPIANVFAGPVVLTGDSITVSYAPHVPNFQSVAQGGLVAGSYLGQTSSSTTNFAQNVVNLNPDTIVFMLGANDSVATNSTAYRFTLFQTHIDTAFDLFEQSSASRVIVLSILPVDEASITSTYGSKNGTGMNSRVNTDYNPWLAAEAAARPKFEYLDLNTAIQSNANWRQDWLHAYGLHLVDGAGEQWLANQVANAVAVPEPSPLAGLALILVVLGARRRIGGSVA